MTDATYEILQFLQEEALTLYPSFPEAFGRLIPDFISDKQPGPVPESIPATPADSSDAALPFGTDGEKLYVHPETLKQCFLTQTERLKQCYLHVHLHCLCLHMIQNIPVPAEDWDLACDLSVTLLSALMRNQRNASPGPELERRLHSLVSESAANQSDQATLKKARYQLRQTGWLTPAVILELFELLPELRLTAKSCALDSHRFWHRQYSTLSKRVMAGDSGADYSGGRHAASACEHRSHIRKLERILNSWQHNALHKLPSARSGRLGKAPGAAAEEAQLQQRDSMDYHSFLRRFAVPGEEAILDMDAFDYIPYYYGLACYGNEIAAFSGDDSFSYHLPFIEPLEYKEVNRLDEFAIAIDTSASCSGTIVRRFLEETWSILRQRENFFSKIRIHLIQCDSMIQSHQIFTSTEEWEAAMPDIRIHGFGNTDFRPVFEHLEKLIQKKEIRHLRGLLYFTDGDGIFPSKAPSWDTAFVFLNEDTEKHEIPSWGIRLNLHLPDVLL